MDYSPHNSMLAESPETIWKGFCEPEYSKAERLSDPHVTRGKRIRTSGVSATPFSGIHSTILCIEHGKGRALSDPSKKWATSGSSGRRTEGSTLIVFDAWICFHGRTTNGITLIHNNLQRTEIVRGFPRH